MPRSVSDDFYPTRKASQPFDPLADERFFEILATGIPLSRPFPHRIPLPSQSRSSARPAARPSAPSGPSGQTRQSSTAAYPQQPHQQTAYPTTAQHPAQTQGRQPGLLAQAASTMGGAVAGSVVGHGISNMLFGGSRHADSAQAADAPPPPAEYARQAQQATGNCDIPAKGERFG